MPPLVIRDATSDDVEVLYEMLRDKAEVEGLGDQFHADLGSLSQMLERGHSQNLMVFLDETPVGFANFHYEDSTFTGDTLINIKDLYTHPEHRGHGIGKALLGHIAEIAEEKGYGVMLIPLTANEKPVAWYYDLGARLSYEGSVLRFDDVSDLIDRLKP